MVTCTVQPYCTRLLDRVSKDFLDLLCHSQQHLAIALVVLWDLTVLYHASQYALANPR